MWEKAQKAAGVDEETGSRIRSRVCDKLLTKCCRIQNHGFPNMDKMASEDSSGGEDWSITTSSID